MIHYTSGNLLEAEAEALVNTVNEVGVMGKGIALMFKEAFPENNREYVKACERGEVRVGRVFITSNESLLGPKWIINFPTKKHWRNPSKLEWISKGLIDLVREIQAREIRSIALPPLGCGNGGLNWRDVRPVIESALSKVPGLEVLMYVPASHYLNSPKTEGIESLTPSRAMIAELTRRYSILGMECSLLEIQKLAWFLDRVLNSTHSPNPLNLQFEPNKYGPYADRLRHLLHSMDGSYLRSEKRIADSSPFDPVYFNESRKEEVAEYLNSEGNKPYLEALDKTSKVIEGFESPLGMELLATVDWLMSKGGKTSEVTSIKDGLASWPSGGDSAARKEKLFDDQMIEVAATRLMSKMP